jgi:hypothetical protein
LLFLRFEPNCVKKLPNSTKAFILFSKLIAYICNKITNIKLNKRWQLK